MFKLYGLGFFWVGSLNLDSFWVFMLFLGRMARLGIAILGFYD